MVMVANANNMHQNGKILHQKNSTQTWYQIMQPVYFMVMVCVFCNSKILQHGDLNWWHGHHGTECCCKNYSSWSW